eukprot:CAMPEP_0174918406 /NCGR_PEP_ID=MMETSP1355-20121228/3056_1 /TAXON_ID=464990 /ORGANISM="Hemiselmis tepida, Strain CCMP443" /LENGTH=35 /DNA_ID= /DNA_START= /DNA_END= /DNA_ORIENTATION=
MEGAEAAKMRRAMRKRRAGLHDADSAMDCVLAAFS